MTRRLSGAVSILFLLLWITSIAVAQRGRTVPTPPLPQGPGGGIVTKVVVRVTDKHGSPLVQNAFVKLYSNLSSATHYATTSDASTAEFDDVPPGNYSIEVTAAGYKMVREDIGYVEGNKETRVSVSMEPDTSGNAAPAAPGPPLLAPKVRKAIEKGMAALKAGNFKEARKQLEAACKLAPANPDTNFLMGLLFLQTKDLGQAQTYLLRTVSLDPHHVSGLVALGQLRLRQANFAEAAKILQQAVSIDPNNFLAHWSLASADLNQGQYENARHEAEQAVKLGKGAANGAELILGEALAGLGRREEAVIALEALLRDAPANSGVEAAKELIQKLKTATPQVVNESASVAAHGSSVAAPIPNAPEVKLTLPSWVPPSVDDARPPVATGAVCPADQVIGEAGKRVEEFAANLDRVAATEYVVNEDLDELGKPVVTEKRKFEYFVSIAQNQAGDLAVDESRDGTSDPGQFPQRIGTFGLPALVLVFHSANRDDFHMTCEGLGEWRGRSTWLVYFRQKQARQSRIRAYRIGGNTYPVNVKGRAWVAADTFQILRLEADLINPMPEIRLLAEHEAIEYGPVQFKKRNAELWLPTTADLYFDFRGHRYHRQHSFRDYMMFSVDTKQKIGMPKGIEESSPDSLPK